MALHALLAVVIASKMAPKTAEAPAMQVTLLQLPPRAAPPRPRNKPPPATPPSLPRTPTAPPTTAARQATPATDWRVRPSEPAEAEAARAGLRSHVGCGSADLLALTKAERVACEDALAKGVENAPTYAVISPKLKKVFDRTFECPKDDVWCEYRIGKAAYPGLAAPRKKKDPSWD